MHTNHFKKAQQPDLNEHNHVQISSGKSEGDREKSTSTIQARTHTIKRKPKATSQ